MHNDTKGTSSPAGISDRATTDESGFTLVETTVALSLALIVAAGLLSMDVITTKQTENYGHTQTRTVEYAQDKMEQLLALAYGNSTTNTAVFPATPTGGTGLAIGGSADPAAPAAGYVDYFQQNGDPGTAGNWYYIRAWQVTSPAANLKQISVTVTVNQAFAGGQRQQTTLSAFKSFPF
jgi:Tfp pilus assembly protein PilV